MQGLYTTETYLAMKVSYATYITAVQHLLCKMLVAYLDIGPPSLQLRVSKHFAVTLVVELQVVAKILLKGVPDVQAVLNDTPDSISLKLVDSMSFPFR